MSLITELVEENKKTGLFSETDTGVSYPLGIPTLDQQLGFYQNINMPDGSVYKQTRLGIRAGRFVMFVGPSSSFKTATAITAAWNIVEPLGEDADIVIWDAEGSTEPQRVMDLTGMSEYDYKQRVTRIDNPQVLDFSYMLEQIKKIAEKKKSDPDRYLYKTGFYDMDGNEIEHYVPTVIVADSLMKFAASADDLENMRGLTAGGRDAILRGQWYRNSLSYMIPYNIIIFMINHLGNAIELQPGKSGSKQLTFIPTGKNVPGGDKPVFYTDSMVVFQPINSKDGIKTESVNGYNGVPVKALVAKSRSGPGGYDVTLQYIQETGFDVRLTLMEFARSKGLIGGRNPSCYFISDPEVKFDTRIFLDEISNRPDVLRSLFKSCKPELDKMVREPLSENEKLGSNVKREVRNLMKELL